MSKPAALALVAGALLASSPVLVQRADPPPAWRTVVMGTQGMVAAEHPLEAQAGLEALKAGGNAIDAAVAVFYMTTVVEHHQAGIGGDGFILAYLADQKRVVFINGTGPAPKRATREFYTKLGGIPDAGIYASDVPGAVGGFDLALKRFGTKGYPELLAPAIRAARDGHPLTHWAAGNHANAVKKLSPYPSSVKALLKNGGPFAPGDLFVQSDLAKSLETIAQGGSEAFYRGPIARTIDEFYRKHDGLLAYDDLAGFAAEEAPPIKTAYRGYEVYQSAPNSQGIAMLIALNILEGFDLKALGHNSADYVHLVTEAIKLGFADRDRYIAVDGLLSKAYAAERRTLVRMDRAIRGAAPPGDPRGGKALLAGHTIAYAEGPTSLEPASPVEARGETSSFSIADRFGNVVSVTHSVNGAFGSGVVVDGLGFVLNNRMPYYSLDAANVNALEPGKRPRHTINPALALKDGRPVMAFNTPGGDNQPQAMLQAFLAAAEFGMSPQQAVEAATVTSTSFHESNYPQGAGDTLEMPRVLADGVAQALAARGHKLRIHALQQPYRQALSGAGAVKLIVIDPATGVMMAGVSPAKDNYALGW
jgi:gamma-glutamyltranspeptidase/glutathione hydrolase